MTVAVQLDFRGATLEQYDEINEILGPLPGGPAWRRELFHRVTKTDTGIRVLDVWESQEAFEEFLLDNLNPNWEEVGIPAPPEIQFFEIYNFFAGERWRG